jgi:vacuolar-type H+-ATPase subunit I/STV1
MDPSWHISENELLFYNSMKMKMSVVLGIFQMTLGILLKASNARFFNQPLDLYLEFLPMIIFDMALFGYMVILIFLKWSINWDARMYSATCLPDTLKTPWGLDCIPGKTTVGKCQRSCQRLLTVINGFVFVFKVLYIQCNRVCSVCVHYCML